MAPDIKSYRKLALPARLAVALHCFERYCHAKGIRHARIEAFIDYYWELPCAPSFPEWDRAGYAEHLSLTKSDGTLLDEIIVLLGTAGVPATEFRQLLGNVVDIIHGSSYSACDEPGSFQDLERVLSTATRAGVEPPPAQPFMYSSFVDNYGWGRDLTPDQRDKWRFHAYDS